jgi:hypothetical protein
METRKHSEFWWEKPDGQRLLGRPRRRCDDNIKMNVKCDGRA